MFRLLTSIAFFTCVNCIEQKANYCGSIYPASANGASGVFSFAHGPGTATYSFTLDLTQFPTTCDLSKGISFHIHSFWNNGTSTSAAHQYCSASITGGHYDPNLACGKASQAASTLCPLIGRTPSMYSCNPILYNTGEFAQCEVGDLSGKFGVAFGTGPGGMTFSFNYPQLASAPIDYTPPYVYNFNKADSISNQWASIVFHCAADGSRQICSKLQYSSAPW